MEFSRRPRALLRTLVLFYSLAALLSFEVRAQEATPKPAEKPAEKKTEDVASPKEAENPAHIELLETRYRFETDGSSRKEVHTRVRINSELGVRQFARLNFDYNRSFESIDIPLVRITHPSGGTADILPSAITDQPNPAVVNGPAYQDVRVKSVRILGLQPGDFLEYRVITLTSHHPLAPDFWLDHSFDRTGVVTQEVFQVDLPELEAIQLRIAPATPATSVEKMGTGSFARVIYRWKLFHSGTAAAKKTLSDSEYDLQLSTIPTWPYLASKLYLLLTPAAEADQSVAAKAAELAGNLKTPGEKAEVIYRFVSQKIATVDLPLGATAFRARAPSQIMASGVATAEDKFALFSALGAAAGFTTQAYLVSGQVEPNRRLVCPTQLTHLVLTAETGKHPDWLDPSIEVAPFGMIPAEFRGKLAVLLTDWIRVSAAAGPLVDVMFNPWRTIPDSLPFKAVQNVTVNAVLESNGSLTSKVKYNMRGDNELLFRVAFHQSPKEKWKDLAQLLSLSDGFRGKVSAVTVSDPYATREPFTLEYEITMPKFVDWSKKPVRIPALLPQVGLPDPPAKPATGAASSPIELGTPLEVETRMTLHLPPGTTVVTPTGTSVQRDYATFASQYSAKGPAITASRHINFLLREVPADRAADYNAFLRAVQNDEAQDFTLDREIPSSPDAKHATPKAPAMPKP